MNIGVSALNLPAMPGVDVDKYNRQINETHEEAEIISCLDIMKQYLDQFHTLYMIDKIYSAKTFSPKVEKVVRASVPSTEVSIFSIAGAIIKALYNVCRWFLTILGKIWSWFFGFFKRTNKDTAKELDEFAHLIVYAQGEVVSHAISHNEIKAYCDIFKAHGQGKGVSPTVAAGSKIDQYKVAYYNAFNSRMPASAKVTAHGDLVTVPAYSSNSNKISSLGWTSGDVVRQGLNSLMVAEEEMNGILKELKATSKDVKKLVVECEAKNYVPNSFIETKGPEAVNAACFITVIVKDIRRLKNIEDKFGGMVTSMHNVCKKYVGNN